VLLIWLAAPEVVVIVALNAWLIGLAIVAARSVPPYRKPGAGSRFFPLRNGLSTERRFLLRGGPGIGRPRQLYIGATRRDYLDIAKRE
jgi:hypothetical protein